MVAHAQVGPIERLKHTPSAALGSCRYKFRDGDDPYFVVAADKGTATFSDVANAIALERNFWLGDATGLWRWKPGPPRHYVVPGHAEPIYAIIESDDGRPLNRGRTHQSFLLDRRPDGIVVDKDREKRSDRRFDVGGGEVVEEIAGPAKEATLEMCRRFSRGKSYHNDVEEARKLGFPDIVVQGMMPLCFVSEMMTDRFGEGWFAGGRMNVNLVNVVWRGDVLICRAIMRELSPEGSRRRAHLQIWCEKEDGTKVVVGSSSAVVG